MLCEYVGADGSIRGPFKYTRSMMARLLARWGIRFTNLPGNLTKPIDLSDGTLYPVIQDKPTGRPCEEVKLIERSVEGGCVYYRYEVTKRNPQALRLQMKDWVSNLHTRYESGYTMLHGVDIRADVEARVNVAETADSFRKGKINAAKWRGKNGKIDVTSIEQIEEIYDAIFDYLHRGFIAKEVAEQEIEAADDTAIYDVDPIAVFNNTIAALEGS